MRNLVLILATLLAVYFYTHPRVETDVQTVVERKPTPPPMRVVVATPPPRMYYHSPLEAGPLHPGASAATGYYSTEPSDPRFRNLNTSAVPTNSYSSAYNGYPVYSGGGSSVTNNTVIYNAPRTANRAVPTPTPVPNVYLGPLPGR